MRRWGLLLCATLLLMAKTAWNFTSARSSAMPRLRRVARRAEEGYDYTPIVWAVDFTVPEEETQRAAWHAWIFSMQLPDFLEYFNNDLWSSLVYLYLPRSNWQTMIQVRLFLSFSSSCCCLLYFLFFQGLPCLTYFETSRSGHWSVRSGFCLALGFWKPWPWVLPSASTSPGRLQWSCHRHSLQYLHWRHVFDHKVCLGLHLCQYSQDTCCFPTVSNFSIHRHYSLREGAREIGIHYWQLMHWMVKNSRIYIKTYVGLPCWNPFSKISAIHLSGSPNHLKQGWTSTLDHPPFVYQSSMMFRHARRRDAAQETLQACRSGGKVNTGALAGGLFGARLQIIGAWLFLNVFSVFASYFIIGRPLLYQFGIDLLPTLPRYWENS